MAMIAVEKQSGVYVITHEVSGKVYVGSTSSSFAKRWHQP